MSVHSGHAEARVAIARDAGRSGYPAAPFAPPPGLPELANLPHPPGEDPANTVYPLVRQTLAELGLDSQNRDTAAWNPLRDLIAPGSRVTLKPNLVYHFHPLGERGFAGMVTHASVLRPLIDYIVLATSGKAEIVIADCPLQEADFEVIRRQSGLDDLLAYYRALNVAVTLSDIRTLISLIDDEGLIVARRPGPGDPKGYAVVDLGRRSALYPVRERSRRLEITNYAPGTVARHHHGEINEYLIGRSMLDCDLFINVPKLKTHKKAGVTLAMKNLIGINGDKSWIAHHTRGGSKSGGDEFAEFRPLEYLLWHFNNWLKRQPLGVVVNRQLRRLYRRLFWRGRSLKQHTLEYGSPTQMEGSWSGNDTLWRTIVDLNNILLFADADGKLHQNQHRQYLAIVDGIVGGERNGPMEHSPVDAGVLVAGRNPVAVDYVATRVMGFDWKQIPQITRGFECADFPLCPLPPDAVELSGEASLAKRPLNFAPPSRWDNLRPQSTSA